MTLPSLAITALPPVVRSFVVLGAEPHVGQACVTIALLRAISSTAVDVSTIIDSQGSCSSTVSSRCSNPIARTSDSEEKRFASDDIAAI